MTSYKVSWRRAYSVVTTTRNCGDVNCCWGKDERYFFSQNLFFFVCSSHDKFSLKFNYDYVMIIKDQQRLVFVTLPNIGQFLLHDARYCNHKWSVCPFFHISPTLIICVFRLGYTGWVTFGINCYFNAKVWGIAPMSHFLWRRRSQDLVVVETLEE